MRSFIRARGWLFSCALACASWSGALQGCGDELEAEAAPACTEQGGCPEGTRCVDGLFCEAIPGVERPTAAAYREPSVGGSTSPGGGIPGGGGQGTFDGGFADGDGGFPGGDGGGFPGNECGAGQSICNELCVALESDPSNCGACGVVCPAGGQCRFGVCCGAAQVVCGNRCVDVEIDPRNCGVCGRDCGTGECLLGTCQPPIEGPGLPPGNPPFGG